jgi:hypothetical protein
MADATITPRVCTICGHPEVLDRHGLGKCLHPDGTAWRWADPARTVCCGCTFDSGYMTDGSSGRPVLVTMGDLARVRAVQDRLLRERPERVGELPVSAADLRGRCFPILERRMRALIGLSPGQPSNGRAKREKPKAKAKAKARRPAASRPSGLLPGFDPRTEEDP